MAKTDYEKIALDIVPIGSHQLSRIELRETIADVLDKVVTAALTAQREKQFPELSQVRLELQALRNRINLEETEMKKKHREKEEELKKRSQELDKALQNMNELFRQREAILAQKEQQLDKLIKAFDAYGSWLDGDGEMDENARRFKTLWEAYVEYRKEVAKKEKKQSGPPEKREGSGPPLKPVTEALSFPWCDPT